MTEVWKLKIETFFLKYFIISKKKNFFTAKYIKRKLRENGIIKNMSNLRIKNIGRVTWCVLKTNGHGVVSCRITIISTHNNKHANTKQPSSKKNIRREKTMQWKYAHIIKMSSGTANTC